MRRLGLPLTASVLLVALVGAIAFTSSILAGDGPEEVELSPTATAWLEERDGLVRLAWLRGSAPLVIEDETQTVTGGYGVDLWELAALSLGFEVEHVVVDRPPELRAAVDEGRADLIGGWVVAPAITDGLARVEPYAIVESSFLVPPGSAALPDDLQGVTVTTIPDAGFQAQLLERFPAATVVLPEGNVREALQLVARGEADAVYGPLPVLGYALRSAEVDLQPVGPTLATVEMGPWAPPDSPALEVAATARAALDTAQLRLVHLRWTGLDLTGEAPGPPAWLWPTLLAALAGLLIVGGFALVLRHRVREATSELRGLNERLEETVDERTAELTDTAARLRRSNKALKRFTSTAAHDLKGPLTAIGGLADVAIRMDLPEEQKEDLLRRVRDSAQRLGRMVDDMLEDAVNMGADVAALTGKDFAAWLEAVTAPELDVVDGRLVVEAPDEPISADVEVLRRSAINLVGNGVKYAVSELGVVIHVTLRRAGDLWELRVDDNGPGIPHAMWSEVFDRGSRLTHDDRGFGLGLAAVRDLVQGAGGSIRVGDSDLGGARFTVTLPAVPTPEPAVVAGEGGEADEAGPAEV